MCSFKVQSKCNKCETLRSSYWRAATHLSTTCRTKEAEGKPPRGLCSEVTTNPIGHVLSQVWVYALLVSRTDSFEPHAQSRLWSDNLFLYLIRVKYRLIVSKHPPFVNQLCLVGKFISPVHPGVRRGAATPGYFLEIPIGISGKYVGGKSVGGIGFVGRGITARCAVLH